ncbi:MAG: class B sortase [Coprococcus sp.]
MSNSNSESKVKKVILNILIVVLLLVAVGSGSYIILYYYKSSKNEKKFDNLKEEIVEDSVDNNGQPKYVKTKEDYILAKYKNLYDKNDDFVGWLKIDGTNIDYPVMYTPDDPDYYIHTDFDGEYSDSGTLFIDANANPRKETSDNILIYGHNMKSGTMFHDLLSYESEDFYKGHKYITFDTLDEFGTYEVIGAMRTEVYADDDTAHYHYYEFFNAADEEAFDEYVNLVKVNTPYTIETTATYGDKLITLSTCAYHSDNGRYIVVAKKIK